MVDTLGHHGLSCARSAGRIPRHASINDVIRRALVSAKMPAILEPTGLARDDGKSPDGMTLVPWSMGRPLVWDATCVDTLAPSHVPVTSVAAGAAASSAESIKRRKYATLGTSYIFAAFGVETLGPWGPSARLLYKDLSSRLIETSGDQRAVCVRLFVPNQYTRARRHPLLAWGAARTQAHAQAPVARALTLLNSVLEAQPQCDLFDSAMGRFIRNNISYADDMVLLSPSIGGLRLLIERCEVYARAHNLKYNVTKSEFMVFKAGSKCPSHIPPIRLNGMQLKRVSSFKYLGHLVTDDFRDDADIERERRALAVRANMIARRFSRCTAQVKITLFRAFCTSLYTCSLWTRYTQRTFNAMRVQYNDAFRVLLRLPRHCSASGMFADAHVDGFHATLRKRCAATLRRVRDSRHSLLSVVAERWDSGLIKHWSSLHLSLVPKERAPGIDSIHVDMLKVDPGTSATLLYPLLTRIWEAGRVPDEWKQGLLVKVPKKGDLSQCDNWRGIMLLPTAAKVLAKILLNRIAPRVAETLRDEQAGFRPGRSCTDHTNTLRILIEQSVEWQSELFLAFVDFEKAFDTVKWSALWSSLRRRGIPECVIRIIRSLYEGSTCRVIHEKEMGAPIQISAGVKQGCLLSPLLFIILLDDVMRSEVKTPRGICWHTRVLEDLDYADDIVLISPSLAHLKAKLESLQEEAEAMGLRINRRKTVNMRVQSACKEPLLLKNDRLESVSKFVYLGSTLSCQGGADDDVESRIKKAKAAFAQLKPVWDSNVLTRRVKISLFESIVKTVLLFGCETWRVTKGLTHKLQVFVNKSLRSILRIFWPKTIRNENLWSMCRQPPIAQEVAQRKWRWIGHTLRRGATNSASIAFEWRPQGGKRARKRPVHTWRRSVENELREYGLSWNEAKAVAQDRKAWKDLVEALCTYGVP
ncbi:uncharacterized protein LOC125225240 [Leguminivora glycinivorella]|uniref:uncharacterized protein LOC125225240 n=1 Tax=Leguminivora glycinivorella TaxID=1035111 RepID=UPI00201028D0|nr:uncharacterized protein LOC125225240 [Leguminivora glycinivorella]